MKSAIALAINDNEHQALVAIMNGLRDGTFVHGRDKSGERPGFTMASFHCGTAGCIGGWVAVLINGGSMNGKVMERMEKSVNQYCAGGYTSMGLYDLYFPDVETHYSNITMEEAAQAIENFLTTGEPGWRAILNEPEPVRDDWTDGPGHDDF